MSDVKYGTVFYKIYKVVLISAPVLA